MKDNNCEQLFFPTATETEDLPQSEVANVDNAAEVVTVDDNPEVVTVDDHPEVVTVDDEPEVVTVSPNEDTQDDAMQNASQFLEVSNDVIDDMLSTVNLNEFPDLFQFPTPHFSEPPSSIWPVPESSNSTVPVESNHFTVESNDSNMPLVTLTNVPISSDYYIVPDTMFALFGESF
jgi:hypothetical protein